MNRLRLIPILVCLMPVVAAGEEASFASPKATMKTLLTILRGGELNRVTECFVEPQQIDVPASEHRQILVERHAKGVAAAFLVAARARRVLAPARSRFEIDRA